jgi:hypothetical protein
MKPSTKMPRKRRRIELLDGGEVYDVHFTRKEHLMRKLASILVCAILFIALPLSAKTAFSGTYSIKGTNPGVGPYTGTLTISPRGGIYDVQWVIGTLRYGGVGVVAGDTLSVAYTGTDKSFIGVIAYTARANGLDGKWAIYGGATKPGTEVATRK